MRGMDGGVEDDDDEMEYEVEDKIHNAPEPQGASLNMDFLQSLARPEEEPVKKSAIEKLRERVENFTMFPENEQPQEFIIRQPMYTPPPYLNPHQPQYPNQGGGGYVDALGNWYPNNPYLQQQPQLDYGRMGSGTVWFEENE